MQATASATGIGGGGSDLVRDTAARVGVTKMGAMVAKAEGKKIEF